MFSRSQYIALSLIFLAVVAILGLPAQSAARMKLGMGTVFLPLFGLASSAQVLLDKTAGALLPRKSLLLQLERLQQENQQLRVSMMQTQEAIRENERLRQLVGFKNPNQWKLKPAQIIGRDPANWWRTVLIDVGSRDGIKTDMPVLTGVGLVGRVSAVGLNYAQVLLVGDPNCRVSAMVQETRENGVINYNSSSVLNPTLVNFTCFSRSSQLKAGQTIITSGIGGIFPKGIRLGEIVDYRSVDYGLYVEARIRLYMNPNQLEEVWVLLP
jgi:rod shape-determining protein MreC